jgi:hypothetical protein
MSLSLSDGGEGNGTDDIGRVGLLPWRMIREPVFF